MKEYLQFRPRSIDLNEPLHLRRAVAEERIGEAAKQDLHASRLAGGMPAQRTLNGAVPSRSFCD
jgi:hypothetical protein